MQSPDHPELAFVQAKNYARGRPDGPPKWIIAHTMEAGESSTRAENTAGYFANPGDGRVVSSHYCADNDSIVCCVRLADTAFTVGNTQGNRRGINWEFAGFAAQTGAQWGDAYSMAMLERAAPYWAADAARYGIPIERRTVAELRAGVPGLSTHNDFRIAFGGTTHTDPGDSFPWPAFLAMINGGSDIVDYTEFESHMDRYLERTRGGAGNTSAAQRAAREDFRSVLGLSTGTGAANTPPSTDGKLDAIIEKLDTLAPAGGLVAHHHDAGETGPAVQD